MLNLVIVESPTKSKTLQKFLGSKYRVEASMGHVRDLPKGELGVDVENNFEPKYVVPRAKTKQINELKKMAALAKTLWLATDPDREGEAIAWHLSALLRSNNTKLKTQKLKSKNQIENIKRVVFHEITPEAVKEAFGNPRDLDLQLVDAQQARRVLDRLVGYKLSPLLWKKVKSGLSAGRVQSVAVRLIVERENEIRAFKAEEYWSIDAHLESRINPLAGAKSDLVGGRESRFVAALVEQNGKKIDIKNKEEADIHVQALEGADYQISKIITKEVRKYPTPPFTTSTLQQTANLKLGLTAKKTMMVAQNLYEHGLITYMRTDSVNLSESAIRDVRSFIENHIGKTYLPSQPRFYKTKSKVAQEAHEAIRPTKMEVKGDQLKGTSWITRDHVRVYDLIWKRTLACQMNEAVLNQTTVEVIAEGALAYTLKATGSLIKFEGWMKVYGIEKSKTGEGEEDEEKEQVLPELTEGEKLSLIQLLPQQHFTEPPARFNDASLIKKLEDLGIGRPSTYAPILSTIQDRFYVEKKEKKFFPTELGETVAKFLMEHFSDIIDYSFTAQMEDELDEVARGERDWRQIMEEFYQPFSQKVEKTEETAERMKVEAEVSDVKCPTCGKNLVYRFGKFGKFLACSGFPECKYTTGLEEKVDANCPDCGGEIVMRKTRRGKPFYGCKNWPTCKFASWTKPKAPKS